MIKQGEKWKIFLKKYWVKKMFNFDSQIQEIQPCRIYITAKEHKKDFMG